jgi:hypothetical protein
MADLKLLKDDVWVSNMGNIYRIDIDGNKVEKSYQFVNGEKMFFHKLYPHKVAYAVAKLFLSFDKNTQRIEFIDKDKTNCAASNLKLVDKFSTELYKNIQTDGGFLYMVSNFGNIKRIKTLHGLHGDTYQFVYPFVKNGTQMCYLSGRCLATDVAKAFVAGFDETKKVSFIDGNFKNCAATNLKWVAKPISKKIEKVVPIYECVGYLSSTDLEAFKTGLSNLTGLKVSQIDDILNGKIFTRLPIKITIGDVVQNLQFESGSKFKKLSEFMPNVPEFPNYEICDNGTLIVNNYNIVKICKLQTRNRVNLFGMRYKLHNLVADAFIPNDKNFNSIKHIDGNVNNNAVGNLKRVFVKEKIVGKTIVKYFKNGYYVTSNAEVFYKVSANELPTKVKIYETAKGDKIFTMYVDGKKSTMSVKNAVLQTFHKGFSYETNSIKFVDCNPKNLKPSNIQII